MTYVPATLGMAGVVVSVVAADIWAATTHRPTISRSIATALEHPVGGPVVIGGLAALAWHLSIDPIIRRLEGATP